MGGKNKRSAINAVDTLVYTIQKKLEGKKLVTALFIDVKGVFDYVSKGKLFSRMIRLDIDRNLVTSTNSFLINQKIQLVINRHNNKKRKIQTGIS